MDPKIKQAIIANLGLTASTPAQQDAVIERVGKLIFGGTMVRILETMSEDDQKELDVVLKQQPTDEMALLNFLQAKVPNLEAIVKEEAEHFRQEAQNVMMGK